MLYLFIVLSNPICINERTISILSGKALVTFSNSVSANFLFLNFENCKYSSNYLYKKLKNKGIILRSTQYGYHIKNKLRLTIGSKKENLKFMNTVRKIFNK